MPTDRLTREPWGLAGKCPAPRTPSQVSADGAFARLSPLPTARAPSDQ